MGREWIAGFANSFLKLNTTAATSFASQLLGQTDSSAAQENDDEALAPFAKGSTEVWEAWKRNGQLNGLKNLRPQFYKLGSLSPYSGCNLDSIACQGYWR
jgi:hypothetical protein